MLPREFIENQIRQIDDMLHETRVAIEKGMQVEESLLEQRAKWLGKIGIDDQKPFLIGLPSLYAPEQGDGGTVA